MKGQEQINWINQLIERGQTALPKFSIDPSQLVPISRKQEKWRYSRLDPLFKLELQPAVQPSPAVNLELPPAISELRLVFVNGWLQPELSQIPELPKGSFIGSLAQAIAQKHPALDQLGKLAPIHEHLFTALSSALINDGLFCYLPEGCHLEQPIEVLYIQNDQEQVLVQPRGLVLLQSGSQAQLIERYLAGQGSLYFSNHITEIQLADGAQLQHHRLQDESRQAWHFSAIYLQQAANSHYQGVSLAFGGHWARSDYQTVFQAENSDCQLAGLYLAGDDQWVDFHLDVHHAVPHCRSQEKFRGLLYGKGRAVFDGRILVAKDAQKSDAQLSNDNLLLSRQAEIDTKPQLEIYADDVKCSHGTTVGQLDPQQLFYLRSRGIAEQRALQMLSLGFAETVIDEIHHDPLKQQAHARLEALLERVL